MTASSPENPQLHAKRQFIKRFNHLHRGLSQGGWTSADSFSSGRQDSRWAVNSLTAEEYLSPPAPLCRPKCPRCPPDRTPTVRKSPLIHRDASPIFQDQNELSQAHLQVVCVVIGLFAFGRR